MRFARWITKATNTHSEYVILITFPVQQWLLERAPVLRYTYIACLLTVILLDQQACIVIKFDCIDYVIMSDAACMNSNQVCTNEHVP